MGVKEDFLRWLADSGASMDALQLRSSADGSGDDGVFLTRDIVQDERVASIPHSRVLSVDKARASPLGDALLATRLSCSNESLLCLYIALGRRDPSHAFHPYLAALPEVPGDPFHWPEALLEGELGGTGVPSAVLKLSGIIQREWERLLPAVRHAAAASKRLLEEKEDQARGKKGKKTKTSGGAEPAAGGGPYKDNVWLVY